jgi:hypothetical protein
MAAINFPAAPADGQVFTAAGITYVWNAAKGLWLVAMNAPVVTAAAPTYDSLGTMLTDPNTGLAGLANTPALITQGQQVFSRSFTAKNPANPIDVFIQGSWGNAGTASWGTLALFIDGATNAVAQEQIVSNANWNVPLIVHWQGVLAAGAHTFQVRFGCSGATGYLNGTNNTPMGGGNQRTTMVIREQLVAP